MTHDDARRAPASRRRPGDRRRRVGRRGQPPPRRGRVRRRVPRAGRLARPRRVPRHRARLGARGPQAVELVAQPPARTPATTDSTSRDSDMVVGNFNGVGGGTVIYNGVWPRLLPGDFRDPQHGRRRRRLAAHLRRAGAVLRGDRPPVRRVGAGRQSRVSARRRPAAPAAAHRPRPACTSPARTRASAGTGGRRPTRSSPRAYDGRHPCVQRGTCGAGCSEGAKASTDLTHWPRAIAAGASLVTGARVARIIVDADRVAPRAPSGSTATAPRTSPRPTWCSAPRAASAPRGSCCSRHGGVRPTGSPTPRAWWAGG